MCFMLFMVMHRFLDGLGGVNNYLSERNSESFFVLAALLASRPVSKTAALVFIQFQILPNLASQWL